MQAAGLIGADHSFTCPNAHCKKPLCAQCKRAHYPLTCNQYKTLPLSAQEDAYDVTFFELAKEMGYMRCSKCEYYVELRYGCNHITCKCRYEFCFQCGARWKLCKCPTWQEERLLEAGRARAGARADNPAVVQRHQRELRRAEECPRHGWHLIKAGCNCDNCPHQMNHFHYRCANCRMRTCTVCRFIRIG